MTLILSGSDGLSDVDGSAATPAIRGTDANTGIFFPAADTIAFAEGGVEAARFDSVGNLGIGITSPVGKLSVKSTYVSDTTTQQRFEDNTGSALSFGGTGGGVKWLNVADVATPSTAYPLAFQTGGTERARIDTSGNLLVGTTSTLGGKISVVFDGSASNGVRYKTTYASNGSQFVDFLNSGGTQIGYISQNGASTVNYSTSSDYRLKNTIAPMTGALAKVALLKPVTYKWDADGSDGQGFIAHELQAVVPDCVTGTKDAVDADGNPKYQGIDTSFLVATLTAAIQEQQAIIESLKARLDAANL